MLQFLLALLISRHQTAPCSVKCRSDTGHLPAAFLKLLLYREVTLHGLDGSVFFLLFIFILFSYSYFQILWVPPNPSGLLVFMSICWIIWWYLSQVWCPVCEEGFWPQIFTGSSTVNKDMKIYIVFLFHIYLWVHLACLEHLLVIVNVCRLPAGIASKKGFIRFWIYALSSCSSFF